MCLRLVLLLSSLVFLKIPACLYNSTMHEEQAFYFFFLKLINYSYGSKSIGLLHLDRCNGLDTQWNPYGTASSVWNLLKHCWQCFNKFQTLLICIFINQQQHNKIMVLIAFHYSSTISIIRLLIIIIISLRLEVKINCATIEVAKWNFGPIIEPLNWHCACQTFFLGYWNYIG